MVGVTQAVYYFLKISKNSGVPFTSLLGCQTQSESGFHFVGFFIYFYFFSVSGKVLPVTPLLGGVFVHRVFCAYFVRFEGAGVMCRFPWCTHEII